MRLESSLHRERLAFSGFYASRDLKSNESISALVRCRNCPLAKVPSCSGPMATRMSRSTSTPSVCQQTANVTVFPLVENNFNPTVLLALADN